jgi:leucyl-tRNA synthetase
MTTTGTTPATSQTDGTQVRYDAALAETIETRWQRWWDEQGVYHQPNPGEPGFDGSRPKFYCLDMFPYPSGAGLHVGHPEGYTATDIICRYKRMRGFNVLHPMGWDAFGLPAEQYAIQTGVHPEITTRKAIDNFRRQLKRFGFCYDWHREFGTIDPDYYRWTQWIFLKMYNAWFDPGARNGRGRTRPIDELIEEFVTGNRKVRLNPAAAEYTGAGDLPGGTEAGAWDTLDHETKRAIIDSYRLAYLSQQTVNWCPKLGTALANEEVIDGRSERGGYPVFRKPLRQWMFRITAYAERLLDDLDLLDWPNSTKTQQAEWIGRSEGAEIDFPLLDHKGNPSGESLRVFTTRPDTIFGATYMVVAPEHPLVELALEMGYPGTDVAALETYVRWARNRSDVERQEAKEKTGVFTGVSVVNPVTKQRVPVWTSDYVLMGYGTGAIMAVPAQDTRDWAFARKFDLPIVRTVQPPEGWGDEAYTGDGPAINSEFLNGLKIAEAKKKIVTWLTEHAVGARRVNYRLRDWLFSRQRYWGEPFPIVFDEKGQHHPVSEDALPVLLPPLADYQPEESDDPQPLLAKAADWVRTTAGAAGVTDLPPDTRVRRETNTMPGWAGSCWYYLRYCDPKNAERFISRDAERYWMVTPELSVEPEEVHDSGTFQPGTQRVGGVDLYIGGNEHAVLHLLYARFWHKALFDLGEVSTPEPFHKLFHQGMITSHAFQRADKSLVPTDEVENHGTDDKPAFHEVKTGERVGQITAKMSKSLKNVINPDDIIASYGADTFRLYEMYMGPLEASKPWNTRDTVGLHRLLQKIWRMCVDESTDALRLAASPDPDTEKRLHRLTAKAGFDIEKLAFNTAIAAVFEFVNAAETLTRDQMSRFVRVIAPFTPHLGEELWHRLGMHDAVGGGGSSVTLAPWPRYDEAMLIDDEVEIPVQILGKLRGKIVVPSKADAKSTEAAALADPRIRELIEGKTVRKVIVVPGRLVNIVVG